MEEIIGLVIQLGFFLILIAIGFFAGTWAEKSHYRSIEEREQKYVGLPAVNIKNALPLSETVDEAGLVYGSTVVSIDYFKRVLAMLKNLVGGNVSSYETLVDRGRRESILRMKEMAASMNADMILNLRIETSSVSQNANGKNAIGAVEVMAYGTAVRVKKL